MSYEDNVCQCGHARRQHRGDGSCGFSRNAGLGNVVTCGCLAFDLHVPLPTAAEAHAAGEHARLRDRFAEVALAEALRTTMSMQPSDYGGPCMSEKAEDVARSCYIVADAMMAARKAPAP